MCDARRFRDLSRARRQSKLHIRSHTLDELIGYQSLFAYHIEALVATSPQSVNTTQTPQRLNGSKDVHFFSVGCLGGRTFVIYMKKKGVGHCSVISAPMAISLGEPVGQRLLYA
jgi:hypothetical protein